MPTLWLVGMMGAGKTTVGRLVAERLGRPFVDLDDEVAAQAGRSLPEIFAAEGESGFRVRETRALQEVAGREVVAACGGGVVIAPENVARLRSSGLVLWLDAGPAELVRRVGTGAGRPLLERPGDLDRLAAERAGLYAGAAHHRIDTTGCAPAAVTEKVVELWKASR